MKISIDATPRGLAHNKHLHAKVQEPILDTTMRYDYGDMPLVAERIIYALSLIDVSPYKAIVLVTSINIYQDTLTNILARGRYNNTAQGGYSIKYGSINIPYSIPLFLTTAPSEQLRHTALAYGVSDDVLSTTKITLELAPGVELEKRNDFADANLSTATPILHWFNIGVCS